LIYVPSRDPLSYGSLYLFGGMSPHWQPLDTLWQLDLDSMTWNLLENENGPVGVASAKTLYSEAHNCMYVFGGIHKLNVSHLLQSTNEFWIYNFTSNSWKNVTEVFNLPPLAGQIMEIYDDRYIFIHGGMTAMNFTDTLEFSSRAVYICDLENSTCVKNVSDSSPCLIDHSGSFLSNGTMIIYGGKDRNIGKALVSMWLFTTKVQTKKMIESHGSNFKFKTQISTVQLVVIVTVVVGSVISTAVLIWKRQCLGQYFGSLFSKKQSSSSNSSYHILKKQAIV